MGGQPIDKHDNWTGRAPRGQVFADGAKMKSISEKEGAGSVMRYEDTEEAIGHVQSETVKHMKGHPLKPGYRY